MSEAELQVQQKQLALHTAIKRTEPAEADWEGIRDDLEKLNWLIEDNNISELINAVWSIIETNACQSLEGITRFRVLNLSRVKVFVTTVAHNISNLRDDIRDICSMCKKYISDFSYFAKANQLVRDSADMATDFSLVAKVYEEAKSQLLLNFIHLDKAYNLEYGKGIGKALDEAFYSLVVSPNKPTLINEASIATLVSKYSAITTTARKPNYSSGFYASYNSHSYQRDSIYLGELDEDDRRNGYGKCTYYNGDIYEGLWRDDKPHGRGVYYWRLGGRYEGDFADGKMDGRGKRSFASGAVYEGDFEAGRKHGHGSIRFKNGDTYEGGWDYDDMSGEGVYTWNTGDSFTGKFRQDRREGPGVLTLESGEVITGEWLDGKLTTSTQ